VALSSLETVIEEPVIVICLVREDEGELGLLEVGNMLGPVLVQGDSSESLWGV